MKIKIYAEWINLGIIWKNKLNKSVWLKYTKNQNKFKYINNIEDIKNKRIITYDTDYYINKEEKWQKQ